MQLAQVADCRAEGKLALFSMGNLSVPNVMTFLHQTYLQVPTGPWLEVQLVQ